MLRYSQILLTACIGSVAVMTGCSTSTGQTDERNRMAAMRYYDNYYGQPPKQHSARRGQTAANAHQAKGTPGYGATHGASGMIVNPAAPKTYVVKKGDTLWGIAQKFLLTPSYWPEIWDKNQRIANPHLIHPGDILHFGYHKQSAGLKTEKLTPRLRIERKGQGQAISTLAPFLAWPKILSDNEIKNAPYILAARNNNLLIRQHDTVYVRNMKNPRPGGRYAVYHPQKPLLDPENGKLLGHQVDYVGYARLEVADKLSSATILEAQNAIRKGDRLFTPENSRQSLRAPIQIPRHKIRGQIVSMYDAEYLGADCMIVVLNRGKQHNIKPGYTVGVYADGKVVTDKYRPTKGTKLRQHHQKTQLPPEKVAEAIVYHVDDNLSYGLILNADREVRKGDKIGNP